MVSLWVVTQSIQIALYGYCLVVSVMFLFQIKSKIVVIIGVNLIILLLGYLGTRTINLEQIFFSKFASIITLIAQYCVPLILLAGHLTHNKKVIHTKQKAVTNEKLENLV